MRTFHTGGVAQSGGDIVSGLPRVEELFEARKPKGVAVMAQVAGTLKISENEDGRLLTIASKMQATEELRRRRRWNG